MISEWYLGIIRGVVLYNPINSGDVQSSSGHIGTQQDGLLGITELEEGLGSLGLFLFSLFNQIFKEKGELKLSRVFEYSTVAQSHLNSTVAQSHLNFLS